MRIRPLVDIFRRFWFPLAVVMATGVGVFGMGQSRLMSDLPAASNTEAVSPTGAPDTVKYDNSRVFTKFRSEKIATDSTEAADSLFGDEKYISARDTIQVPDSLKDTDPFRYKYYIALVDSLTHVQVRDSLKAAGDTIDWPKIDSIYFADSAALAKKKFEEWYASLDKVARKKYDFEQKSIRKQHLVDSILNAKDSLMAIKDSIREAKPRILETFAVPKEKQYERILVWNKDPNFNDVRLTKLDTSYNYWFHDQPPLRKDVNISYLGTAGSATQTYDFFKRTSVEGVSFYAPYEPYSYAPSTIPMYNTKTAYTELAYWGTLFSNTQREEANVHVMTTQNIFPELNYRLEYNRYGSRGMLNRENTDNRTFAVTVNYMGKRYLAHLGYISNKIDRTENGGIADNFWIRDTTVGSKEIATKLSKAANLLKKKTVFLDQTYRIPFNFIARMRDRKALKVQNQHYRDSVTATGDSGAIALIDTVIAQRFAALKEKAPDTLNTNVTTAFIGHSSEYSVYTKNYTDAISTDDDRAFYHDKFYINPNASADSLRVMKFDNKFFIKLQPWAETAIVSNINAGLGYRMLNYYMFRPEGYLKGGTNTAWNSTYLYGGVNGQLRNSIKWNANGFYTFAGQESGESGLSADAHLNLYPFRRHKDSPFSVNARFETTLKVPEYYQNHYFSNHYKWENDFSKVSTTKVEGSIEIPHRAFKVGVSYALLKNGIYYDTLGVIRQNSSATSVIKASLSKNFKLWLFHLDNTALFQYTSDKDALPLPPLALNLKWYFQTDVVKDVMQLQLGVDATYTNKWYAPAYSPALGQFITQKHEKYGGSPYIDAFVNVQWKRACIFVKVTNVNMGWPSDKPDYFSADGYIRPQRTLKFGVSWPFYLQTRKNSVMSVAGSEGGGGKGSSGRGKKDDNLGSEMGGSQDGILGGSNFGKVSGMKSNKRLGR